MPRYNVYFKSENASPWDSNRSCYTVDALRAKLKLSLNGKEQAMLPMAVVATKLSELKRLPSSQ